MFPGCCRSRTPELGRCGNSHFEAVKGQDYDAARTGLLEQLASPGSEKLTAGKEAGIVAQLVE
ncbi:hypothetical protein [Devosia ginsengisoli]|uniref:Uncharacterized protein n=1 Tax=Devosia ginsengisoli TaxID=400770 RepID=A0A5B8LPG8_9HYPH|nr:hypothetical protein [Devosia ginsengisoli]QDZ09292.1 hypothetical protein FPZ08_00050 [Devosia ginsengisoli]